MFTPSASCGRKQPFVLFTTPYQLIVNLMVLINVNHSKHFTTKINITKLRCVQKTYYKKMTSYDFDLNQVACYDMIQQIIINILLCLFMRRNELKHHMVKVDMDW